MSDKHINGQGFDNQSSTGADSSYDEIYEDGTVYTEDDADQWSDDVDLSDGDGAGDQEAAVPQKKRNSPLTVIIILLVAVVGVFGFMILTGDKGSESQPEVESQVKIDAAAEDPATSQPPADVVPQQPNMTDLQGQADQSAQSDQTVNNKLPTPAPLAPQQGLMENPDLLVPNMNTTAVTNPSAVESAPVAAPDQQPPLLTPPADLSVPDTSVPVTQLAQSQEVVKAISPTVKPVSDFPTVDSIKKPDAAVTSDSVPAPVLTETRPVLSVAEQVSLQDDKSAQLQAQVDAAQDRIDLLEKQLSDKNAELDAQKKNVSPAVSDDEVEALKRKITDLEEKLANNATRPIVAERRVVEEESYSAHRPVVKKTVTSTKPKVVAQKQAWSLKSASIGKAILSEKATGDLETVRVGDVVSGLGRIVSISNVGSLWVVKGTSGSVSE